MTQFLWLSFANVIGNREQALLDYLLCIEHLLAHKRVTQGLMALSHSLWARSTNSEAAISHSSWPPCQRAVAADWAVCSFPITGVIPYIFFLFFKQGSPHDHIGYLKWKQQKTYSILILSVASDLQPCTRRRIFLYCPKINFKKETCLESSAPPARLGWYLELILRLWSPKKKHCLAILPATAHAYFFHSEKWLTS